MADALEKADVIPPNGFRSSDGGPIGGHLRKSQQHLLANSASIQAAKKAEMQQEMHNQTFRESMPPHIQAQMQQQERRVAPQQSVQEPRFQNQREAVLYDLGVRKGQLSSGQVAAGGGFLYGVGLTLCAVGVLYLVYRTINGFTRQTAQTSIPPHPAAVTPNAAPV